MMNLALLAVVIRIIVSIIVIDDNAYLRYAEPEVITLQSDQKILRMQWGLTAERCRAFYNYYVMNRKRGKSL